MVRAGLATKIEIERDWSIDDLFDAGAIITAFEYAEYKQREKDREKK